MGRTMFLVSGRTGSGKTAITRALAQRLDVPQTSFGAAVRAFAQEAGQDAGDKAVLQAVGKRLIVDEPDVLCSRVLGALPSVWRCAFVEGLRHIEILEMFRTLLNGDAVRLIYVQLDEPTRIARLLRDRGWSAQQCAEYDRDSTELQLAQLARLADFVVDNSGDLGDAVASALEWVSGSLSLERPG